ncbi:MAG: glycosyltransferase family 2 protein [Nitrospirae bacterium]|nr:glycosyltransferase family 2 protein [Nitrospirota bacterium]
MVNKIDIIMVAFNEADSIEEVLRSFYAMVSKYAETQIIVAEDGSIDGTREILKGLTNELPLKLELADNRRGYAGAVKDALIAATNDTIIFVDSDGQYLTDDFPNLFAAWNSQDKDMVIGEKVDRQDPPHRILISWIYHSLVRLSFKVPFKDMDCGYRFIRRELALNIAPECHLLPYSYWSEFTVRAYRKGFKIATVPIGHRDRLAGASRMYPFRKLPSMTIKQLRGLWTLYGELRSSR